MTRLLVHITCACLAVAMSACVPDPEGKPPVEAPPVQHAPARVELVQDCGEIPLGGRTQSIVRLHAPPSRDISAQVRVSHFARLTLPDPSEGGFHATSIPAGTTKDLEIGCRGDQLGSFAADVIVELLEETRTRVLILEGHVRGASLELNPKVIDFGDVAVFPGRPPGLYARRSLVLRNGGNAPLQLETLRVETLDGKPSEEFSSSLRGGSLPPEPGHNAVRLEVGLAPTVAGAKQILLYIESNDPRTPTRAVRIQANAVEVPPCELEITPASIDFGQLASNQVSKATVQLRNLGTAPEARCLVSGVRVSGANAFFTSSAESMEFAPGATGTLELTAISHGTADPAGRNVTGELEFLVSDPNQPARSVALNANLSPSCIEHSSPSLVLHAVGPACAVRDSIVLKNVCSEPVTLLGIDEPQAPFTLVQSPAVRAGGLQLASGAQTTISVRYGPDASGLHEGSIPIQLEQAGVVTTRELPLHGISASGPLHSDSFVESQPIGPDILIVIDNGAPLAPLLESVRQNLAGLARYAFQLGRDTRIAVTTTAGAHGAGRAELVPDSNGQVMLSTTAPDFQARFNALISGLTVGASKNDVLATALDAVSSAQMKLRDQAHLSVLTITAAPDRSPGTIDSFQWRLERLKLGRPTFVTFAAIAPFAASGSCTAEADDGRIARLVQVTNGVREDICQPDWESVYEPNGRLAWYGRHMLWLSRPIDPFRGAVSVRIDGDEYPAIDNRGAPVWTVVPEAHGIAFEPMYVPAPGQVTEITYPVACWE